MPEPSTYTFKLTDVQGATLKEILAANGFEFAELAYGHFAAKKLKCSIGYYESGKLVVQGKDAKEFIEFTLEPLVLGEAKLGYDEVHHPEMFEPHFGVDESGKGDLFGPLVIAGAYVDKSIARRLLDLGVKDSKLIKSDKNACDLADAIRENIHSGISVITLMPEKYNDLHYRMRNLNILLAWAHATVIENLLKLRPDCPRALSDQFANPKVLQLQVQKKGYKIELLQRTKAESDIAVAAASIIARAEFIRRMDSLGERFGMKLAKGVSPLVKKQAAEIFTKHGAEALSTISKTHFKTFSEIVDNKLL